MKNEIKVSNRKGKALLLLPLFIIPFLTLGFWALGGGRGDGTSNNSAATGLNLQLPGAQLKDDKGEDKMSFYEASEKDSARWKEDVKNDPMYRPPSGTDKGDSLILNGHVSGFTYDPSPQNIGIGKDPNEQKVYQKLAELNRQLGSSVNGSAGVSQKEAADFRGNNTGVSREEVDRLDGMMKTMNHPQGDADPEMQQLNGMMEKVLDIQHPDRVRERMKESATPAKGVAGSWQPHSGKASVSLLDTQKKDMKLTPGFYGLEEDQPTVQENTIPAVIHERQALVSGSVVKLRLLQDIEVKGAVIAKETFVYGVASLNGERLEITINSIRSKGSLYPVAMEVYDMDGLPGLYVPGAITREVAKQTADNSLQMLELSNLDPSLKAQAAGAGLSAVKTLLLKKTKQVRVVVKAGYQVLLKDKNSQ